MFDGHLRALFAQGWVKLLLNRAFLVFLQKRRLFHVGGRNPCLKMGALNKMVTNRTLLVPGENSEPP